MKRYERCCSAVLAAGFGLAVSTALFAQEFTLNSSFERNGLKVEMDLEPLADKDRPLHESEDVKLRFRIREAGSDGKPLSGLLPLSWMVSRDEGEAAPDDKACNYEIRSLLAGRLAHSAEVNLNEYLLITLDDNNSISIIDPQIESSRTKTLGIVSLTSKGEDFVLAPDRRDVLVTLPTQGRIAAADIFKRKARYLDPGGHPRRIELQPDQQLAWVGDASEDKVHAVDIGTFELLGSVTVGPGPHEMAFPDNSRELYVVSPASDQLSIIDTQSLELKEQVATGDGAISVAYSAFSGAIYAAMESGTIKVINRERREQITAIDTGMKTRRFAVSPDGRVGFALHTRDQRVSIVDLAANKVAHRVTTRGEPGYIAFTDTFAYIHHDDNGDATLLDLASLSKGGAPMVSPVVMGRKAPASGKHETIAPIMAPLPEGAGALVMNAADRSVYHYMEGMNNPMGSYRTFPWTAKGILISDRTIREVEKGVYQTEFRLPGAGTYTMPFLIPSGPKLYGCFTVEVRKKGVKKRIARLHLKPVDTNRAFTAGNRESIRIHLSDPDTGEAVSDIKDLMMLVMRGPRWQWRGVAEPLGDGLYQVDVIFPDKGQYMVMAASKSRKISYGKIRSFSLMVEETVNTADGQDNSKDMSEGDNNET